MSKVMSAPPAALSVTMEAIKPMIRTAIALQPECTATMIRLSENMCLCVTSGHFTARIMVMLKCDRSNRAEVFEIDRSSSFDIQYTRISQRIAADVSATRATIDGGVDRT